MANPAYKHTELYIKGLVPEIQSMVTATNLPTVQQIIRLAHRLTDQAVEQGKMPKRVNATTDAPSDNKRKWDGNLSHPNRWRNHRGAALSETDCPEVSTTTIIQIQ
ncbi:hypothetical protein HanIR_Chr10g0464671 [Helianthus annuus]|nr:hypothetical protein HanIR_Chr10g0464671 [Helianthus annuus]